MNSFADRFGIGVATAAAVGIAASSGHPAGMALMCLMPPLAMLQANRRDAFVVAAGYYAGATWPVIPAARNFFGPEPSVLCAAAMWLTASLALAAPWPVVWTAKRGGLLWRVPLGLAASAIPPLGIIGWASPLSSAGLLFPGTAWLGLIVTAILPTVCVLAPRRAIPVAILAVTVSNAVWQAPQLPKGWEAINTNLGAISHGEATPAVKLAASNWLQERALRSRAHVLVFPEAVVPMWTDATELFWQQTLAELHASGKTIVIGAGIPTNMAPERVDFSADLAPLGGELNPPLPHLPQSHAPGYLNATLIRGAERGIFRQRIPVPLGMWHPFDSGGVPLNIFGRGVIEIAAKRAAILICYEQLLVWPVLESVMEHATVILAISNDYWVTETSIPRYQRVAVSAWSRLFRLPCVAAVSR